jgi:membrane protease YdiL (CAAX protease family)
MFEQSSLDGLIRFLLSWATIAVLGGLGAFAIWWMQPSVRQSILPPQRVRFVPWRLMDVALVAFLFAGGDFLVGKLFHIEDARYTLGAAMRVNTHADVAAGVPGGTFSFLTPLLQSEAGYQFAQVAEAKRQLAANAVIRPIQFVVIVLLLVYAAGGQLYQLGLSTYRWPQVLLSSYLAWVVISLLTFAIYWAVLQLGPPDRHPVDLLIANGAGWWWIPILITVLIGAPLLEELLFRGFLQPIMVQSPELADLTVLLALIGIIVQGSAEVWELGVLRNPWPVILLVGTGGGYLAFERVMWRWLPRPGAARAIYATSVLFAALHAAVWPTPIPLFFLSLGIGYLGYRTQSLLGPIVVHSLFNLVTVGELLLRR